MHNNESLYDSDTQVPRQVRERAERARKLMEAEEVVIDDPNEEAAGEPQVLTETVNQPAVAPEFDFAASNLLDAPAQKMTDPVYWRHRASAMQGMFKVEQDRLKGIIAARDGRIRELELEVSKLQVAKPVVEADIDLTKFFTPEQIDTYGEEHAMAMAKAAQVAARDLIQQQIIAPKEEQHKRQKDAEAEAAKTEFDAFLGRLTALVPNWRVIDAQDSWKKWLADKDAMTLMQRQDTLDYHIDRRNESGCAKMFNEFLASFGGERVNVPENPPMTPKGGAAGSTGQNAQPALRPLQPGEAKEYYKQKALGRTTAAQDEEFDKRLKLAYS